MFLPKYTPVKYIWYIWRHYGFTLFQFECLNSSNILHKIDFCLKDVAFFCSKSSNLILLWLYLWFICQYFFCNPLLELDRLLPKFYCLRPFCFVSFPGFFWIEFARFGFNAESLVLNSLPRNSLAVVNSSLELCWFSSFWSVGTGSLDRKSAFALSSDVLHLMSYVYPPSIIAHLISRDAAKIGIPFFGPKISDKGLLSVTRVNFLAYRY